MKHAELLELIADRLDGVQGIATVDVDVDQVLVTDRGCNDWVIVVERP